MWYEEFDPLRNRELKNIVFHGGRGGAKSWHFAIELLNQARHEKLLCLCVREIQRSIKESVHRILKQRIEDYGFGDYKVKEHSIVNTVTGSEIIFLGLLRNIDAVKSYEGIDRVWVEEAQSISTESLDYLIPTIRKKGSQIWWSANRFSENDPFWEAVCKNPSDDTVVIKINIMDLPKDFHSDHLIKLMNQHKVEDYDKYLWIWEGEPMGQDPQSILSRGDVNLACKREIEIVGGKSTGADIARFGDDRTVFFRRHGLKIINSAVYRKLSIVQCANRLMEFAEYDKKEPIKIDDTGLGGGVTDILKSKGYNVKPVNFGNNGEDILQEPDLYYNVITEMWFYFKSIIKEVQIPDDIELKSELSNRLFLYKPDERKIVERKEDYKKRHTLSPDKADALLLCYYQPKVKDAYFGVIDHDWIGGGM